ncbi:cell division protein ZipA-like [Penaeus japonicus]|uniref:cell division protein ZipA-like n=1 Tax=Penaeus japonicus TaxID=27405 RepID=UPI001C715308|nr:cell division protein ZipA-like [Penaeus japonicus]
MAGTRCNLHRLFSTLLLASTLSLFVVNFYGFVLEVGEDPNPQRRNARDRGKSEDLGAEKSLSVEEKALLVAHSGKDQTPIQTQGQNEVQAQAQHPSEPQARVLQPPPLQTRVPKPPEPLTTPKKVPEPPESLTTPKKVPEPPEPLTTPKKVPEQPPAPQTEPPKTPGKGSESPGLPTSANRTQLAELQMNAPKPATPQPEAPVEWINKSSKCLPLPGKVHVVPIPQEGGQRKRPRVFSRIEEYNWAGTLTIIGTLNSKNKNTTATSITTTGITMSGSAITCRCCQVFAIIIGGCKERNQQ